MQAGSTIDEAHETVRSLSAFKTASSKAGLGQPGPYRCKCMSQEIARLVTLTIFYCSRNNNLTDQMKTVAVLAS